jgi:hypothetical protein
MIASQVIHYFPQFLVDELHTSVGRAMYEKSCLYEGNLGGLGFVCARAFLREIFLQASICNSPNSHEKFLMALWIADFLGPRYIVL